MSASIKPQLFIDLGQLSITELQIKQAFQEQHAITDINIQIKASHDKLKLNCAIALPSQDQADQLIKQGAILIIGSEKLHLEAYQAQYPNVFLMNEANTLSSEVVHTIVSEIVKGSFQVYYGTNQVSLHVADEAEAAKLIGEKRVIGNKTFVFEKYISTIKKNAKNHLFLDFNETPASTLESSLPVIREDIQKTFGPIQQFERKGTKPEKTTISIVFEEPNDAQKFYDHIQATQSPFFDQKNVTVSWKRSEDADINNRIVCLKFLKPSLSEQQIRVALAPFAPIENVQFLQNTQRSSAFVTLSSNKVCTDLMCDAKKYKDIKDLFVKTIYIAPYIPKSDVDTIQKISGKSRKTLVSRGQEQPGFVHQVTVNQPIPQQFQQFQQIMPQVMQNPQQQIPVNSPFYQPTQAFQGQMQYQPHHNDKSNPNYRHQHQYQGNNYNNQKNNQQAKNNKGQYRQNYHNQQKWNYNQQQQQQHHQQLQQTQQQMYMQYGNQQYTQAFPTVDSQVISQLPQQQYLLQQQQQHSVFIQQQQLYQQQMQNFQPQFQQPQLVALAQTGAVYAQQIMPSQSVKGTSTFGLSKEDMKAEFKRTQNKDVYQKTFNDLVKQELLRSFPQNINLFELLIGVFYDEENLTNEERIDAIFDQEDLVSKVKEGVELILNDQQDNEQ